MQPQAPPLGKGGRNSNLNEVSVWNLAFHLKILLEDSTSSKLPSLCCKDCRSIDLHSLFRLVKFDGLIWQDISAISSLLISSMLLDKVGNIKPIPSLCGCFTSCRSNDNCRRYRYHHNISLCINELRKLIVICFMDI